eukprot:2173453-Pleurochrysis_carterae.AAC.1
MGGEREGEGERKRACSKGTSRREGHERRHVCVGASALATRDCHLLQDARAPHDARVLLDRDEVRVRPLAVEIVERLALRLPRGWLRADGRECSSVRTAANGERLRESSFVAHCGLIHVCSHAAVCQSVICSPHEHIANVCVEKRQREPKDS